jgi:very-short-patch-repair endonuclease
MPDIILEEQMTIVEIYGDKYHDKPDKIKSDLVKNKKLAELGYKIYIIKASEIDRLTQSSLRELVLGIYASSMTMEKYNHIIAGEKELPFAVN